MAWKRDAGDVRPVYKVWLAGILGVGLIVSIGFLLRSREPVYEGKRLSEWLLDLDHGQGDVPAARAVRAMGTNSFPFLLAGLAARDSGVAKFCSSFVSRSRLEWVGFRWAVDRRRRAVQGFMSLGPDGLGALPGIVMLLTNEDTCLHAAVVAGYLGPVGLCALTNAAVSWSPKVRLAMLSGLNARFIPGVEPEREVMRIVHLPFLLLLLGDRDADVRGTAAEMVGRLGADPEHAVPALVKLLDDPELLPRHLALSALAAFGPGATSAVPAVVRRVKLANGAGERETAIWVLQRLDPAATAAEFGPGPRGGGGE